MDRNLQGHRTGAIHCQKMNAFGKNEILKARKHVNAVGNAVGRHLFNLFILISIIGIWIIIGPDIGKAYRHAKAKKRVQEIIRQSGGWESFAQRCMGYLQAVSESPYFKNSDYRCTSKHDTLGDRGDWILRNNPINMDFPVAIKLINPEFLTIYRQTNGLMTLAIHVKGSGVPNKPYYGLLVFSQPIPETQIIRSRSDTYHIKKISEHVYEATRFRRDTK